MTTSDWHHYHVHPPPFPIFFLHYDELLLLQYICERVKTKPNLSGQLAVGLSLHFFTLSLFLTAP